MKRERINQIAALVDKRGVITLVQLREFFPKVSEMTLRRDLFQLEEEGRLIRVRGGAKSMKDLQKTSGVPYAKNTNLHATEKRTIGAKAAELIMETDHQMKTSFDDPERLLEILLLRLAQEARNG